MEILRAPIDTLREGLGASNLAQSHARGHPVAEMARAHPKGEWELKMATLESVYGRHAAMHARMEAAIVAQPLGAGLLAGTDAFGLDTLLGNQMRFGTADAFGNPFEQPEMPFDAVDVHTAAEIASAGPAIPVGLMRR